MQLKGGRPCSSSCREWTCQSVGTSQSFGKTNSRVGPNGLLFGALGPRSIPTERFQLSKVCSAKGSSVSWVAKFKGDERSECKLSNGWRSYEVIKLLLFLQGNEWSRSYRVTNQHPTLPRNSITDGFPDLSGCPTLKSSPLGGCWLCDIPTQSGVSLPERT